MEKWWSREISVLVNAKVPEFPTRFTTRMVPTLRSEIIAGRMQGPPKDTLSRPLQKTNQDTKQV